MFRDLILAIDNGTQSVRALAFDLKGGLVGKASVKLDGYTSPHSGWMEHDVEGFWQAVCAACQGLWGQGVVAPDRIAGLVITTQRATVINLDVDGQPLRPAIIWADQRRTPTSGRLPFKWKLLFGVLGLSDTIAGFEQEAESNWIATHQPDLWDATDKFLLLSGYLNFCFTGRYVDAVGNQVGYIPFDYRKMRWASASDWKWPVLGIDPGMLPELVPSGGLMGNVTPDAAAATGLPAGLPVLAGASDKACEVLGSGALSPEIGAISCGTTATLNVTTRRYFEAIPFIPPYPAALPEHYNTEVQVMRGYWMVSWFAEQFGLPERQRGDGEGKPPEAYFDELIATTPPGAEGLILQPFWNPGVRDPGTEARGSIIGFTDTHTRAHVYRAIIEGLAYALREGRGKLEKRGKVPITRLRVAGGGSQSDAVMQIIADVFNLPAERPALYEASGLGAAIIGAVALGHYPDYAAAVATMTSPGRMFQPIADNVAIYDRNYTRVYARLYQQLKPLYQSLQEII
jgi:sugar (pentulose or hexulose) kinase